MKQGDIVLVSFPFADLSSQKVRPAVVLSNDVYNTHHNVLLAGIYGKTRPCSITLTNESLAYKKLNKQSYISLQNIFSIERTFVGETIDTLTPTARKNLLTQVKKYL
jgi:mRNA interferase MazF